jgi:hypothetical protein
MSLTHDQIAWLQKNKSMSGGTAGSSSSTDKVVTPSPQVSNAPPAAADPSLIANATAAVQPPASGAGPVSNPYAGTDNDNIWRSGFDAGFSQPDEDHYAPSPYTPDAQTIYSEGVLAGQEAARQQAPHRSEDPHTGKPPPPPAPPPDEQHGAVWNFLHDHGLVQTDHERADDLRRAWGPPMIVTDDDGNPIDVEKLSDEEIISLNKKLRGLPIGPASPAIRISMISCIIRGRAGRASRAWARISSTALAAPSRRTRISTRWPGATW